MKANPSPLRERGVKTSSPLQSLKILSKIIHIRHNLIGNISKTHAVQLLSVPWREHKRILIMGIASKLIITSTHSSLIFLNKEKL